MRVHHLAFRTGDLARLEHFYVHAVGLTVVRRTECRSVWLDAGGSLVMLELADSGEPSPASGAMDLVAFEIARNTRAFYTDKLAKAGVALEGSTDFTLYVRDPDGRRIGLSSFPAPLV